MAQILIHTSSDIKMMQQQALILQSELQQLGHLVDFSTESHPFRILKNKYDIFHLLTDSDKISAKDCALIMMSKLNRTSTVVSSYDFPEVKKNKILNKFLFNFVDAFSGTNTDCLKSNSVFKNQISLKQKFILPFFTAIKKPLQKNKAVSKNFENSVTYVKVLTNNFNEIEKSNSFLNKNWIIDGSNLMLNKNSDQINKNWKAFKAKNPVYQNCQLILNLDYVTELLESKNVILDLSSVSNSFQFQFYFDLSQINPHFIILNANQASSLPHYWKHQYNCWINNLKELKNCLSNTIELTQQKIALDFIANNPKDSQQEMLQVLFDKKMNELSRVYSKLIFQESITYAASEVKKAQA